MIEQLSPSLRAALTALAVSLVLTPIVRAIARSLGMVALPSRDRWSARVVALLGGTAIFGGVLAAALMWHVIDLRGESGIVFGAAAIMFAVGLYDDYVRLKPSTKLIAQLAVASTAVQFGLVLPVTPWLAVNQLITIFWFVGITNAFNLLDNMDGLCAGVALVASASFCVSLVLAGSGSSPVVVLAAALAGSLAGFLVYNFQPASIFMGDSGSLFIGFMLAGLTAATSGAGSHALTSLASPVLIMLIPIFDTTFVTISRKLSGRRASTGGTDHTSHRLVALGFSERSAVLILWGLAAAGGGAAIMLRVLGISSGSAFVGLLIVAMVLVAIVLGRVRVYEGQDFAVLARGRITPILVEFMYKRRILEVLLDFLLVVLAYWSAYHLRWEGEALERHFSYFLDSLPIVIASTLVSFFATGVYRGTWRYFGLHDLPVFLKGIGLSAVLTILVLLFRYRFEGYSRSIFIINAMVLTLLAVGARLSFRAIGEIGSRKRASGRRVLIYGAGDGGALVVRELLNNTSHGFRPIGFLDDEASKARRRIQGFPVLGGVSDLERLVVHNMVDVVVLSTDKVRPDRLATLKRICAESATPLIRMEFNIRPVPVEGSDSGAWLLSLEEKRLHESREQGSE